VEALDLTPRILGEHVAHGELAPGEEEEIDLRVDRILIEDATGTMCGVAVSSSSASIASAFPSA
jgi:hypothetical protein